MKGLQRRNMRNGREKVLCNIYVIFGNVVKVANGQLWNSGMFDSHSRNAICYD